MPTYQCTAACMHCGTYSSPKEGTWLDEELMMRGIAQAIDAGYRVVVFTGGEPTLAADSLLRAIRYVSERGVGTRIVTNGWWAETDVDADRVVKDLCDAGLDEINFSTGDQHARFVSVDNVVRAARAASKARLKTIIIMVETVQERSISRAYLSSRQDVQSIFRDYPDTPLRFTESPWMPLSPTLLNDYPEHLKLDKRRLPLQTGCDSCLKTTTLQANGNIGACCGLGMRKIPELQLGNIADTTIAEADAKAGDDFLKRWIRVEGPEKILAWAATHDDQIEWENMYAHRCQACIRLYKDDRVRNVIREHHVEKMPDVLFGEWLLYHYDVEQDGTEAVGDGSHDAVEIPALNG